MLLFLPSFGIARISSSSTNPFGRRPSRIASTISGASSVSRSSRLTKLRLMRSASAGFVADRCPPSLSRRLLDAPAPKPDHRFAAPQFRRLPRVAAVRRRWRPLLRKAWTLADG
jgi:hypothetical protein